MVTNKNKIPGSKVLLPEPAKRKLKPRSSEPLDVVYLKGYKYSQVKDPNYQELAEFDDVLTEILIDKVRWSWF